MNDLFRSFQICSQDCLFMALFSYKSTRVDINSCEGLRLIYDERTTRGKPDFVAKCSFNLIFNPKMVKNRLRSTIIFN